MSELHIDIGSLPAGLQTAYGYLAEGNWRNANDCFDLVLKQTPLDPYACLGKAMTACCLKTPDELNYCSDEILENPFFSAALKYADGQLKSDLTLHVVRMNYDRQKVLAQKPAIDPLNTAAAKAAASSFDPRDPSVPVPGGQSNWNGDDYQKYVPPVMDVTGEPQEGGLTDPGATATENPVAWNPDNADPQGDDADAGESGAGEEEETVDIVEGGGKKNKKIIIAIVAAAVFMVLFVGVGLASWFYLIPVMKYNKAVDLINAKQYDEGLEILKELGDFSDAPEQYKTGLYVKALNYLAEGDFENSRAIFEELGDFKDSQELIGTIEARRVSEEVKAVAAVNVGDIVTFGKYETDGNAANGKEAMTWLVLNNRDDLVTLIAEKSIAAMQYNSSTVETNWAECSLRTWLNETFFKEAFDTSEADFICKNYISTPSNPDYPSPVGTPTVDNVYLLSLNEVLSYFASITERKLKCTDASYSNTYTDGNDYCCWWLRTPGAMLQSAVGVDTTGQVVIGGYDCYENEHIGVRPVIVIDISPVSQGIDASSDDSARDNTVPGDATAGDAVPGAFSNETTSSGSRSSGKTPSGPFTNAFGSPTTICAHPGCNNYIASSGDTNCCTVHSSKCLTCGKYIDEGTSYCTNCRAGAPETTTSAPTVTAPATTAPGATAPATTVSVSLSSVSTAGGRSLSGN